MKEQLEKYKFEIDEKIINFIEENERPELTQRIYSAVIAEALDDDDKGNVNQTFTSLASVVSTFLKMMVKIAKREGHEYTCKELSDNFSAVLDAYCQIADLEAEINEKENNDGQGDTEANPGD